MKTIKAPKKEPASICGRLCGEDKMTHLVTRLDLVQGDVLEMLEQVPRSLHEIMHKMEWPPCAVAMAVGALLGNGLVRASERNGEVILEIYDPSARGTTAVGTRPDVLEAIRKDVCMHCVEYGEDGKCHHESDTECSVFHFLPELVRISNQIHSEKMDDYIAAVRSRVCALCSHAEGEKCSVREQLDCALDRYLSLVIDSLERLQDTLEHTRKAA